MKKTAGFTMVELIVVIAIIGILSSIIYVSFDGVRDDAKNRAMETELKEMQLALEVYRSQNGEYPDANTATGLCSSSGGGIDAGLSNASNLCDGYEYIDNFEPDFIARLPRGSDSGNPACIVRYEVDNANNAWYKLTAENCFAGATEAAEGIGEDEEFSQCPSSCGNCNGNTYNAAYVASADFYETMAVYSFGGECQ